MDTSPTRYLSEQQLWPAVDDQRRRLVGLLQDLSPAEWDSPSLCTEWTVKQVVAHLAWGGTASQVRSIPSTLGALLRARGDAYRAVNGLAVRWAEQRTAGQLVAEIQALIGHHRHPFSVTDHEVLVDTIVHHQDIAIALGRAPDGDPVAAAAGAERSWSLPPRLTIPVTRELVSFQWRATDVDWARGTGAVIEGPMVAILAALLGRPKALDHLTGAGVEPAQAVMHAAGSGD